MADIVGALHRYRVSGSVRPQQAGGKTEAGSLNESKPLSAGARGAIDSTLARHLAARPYRQVAGLRRRLPARPVNGVK